MHHPIIHILLAMQLALWTPVTCCCAIKSVMGTVTGVNTHCAEQNGCCAKQIAKKPEPACPKCASQDDTIIACDGNMECSTPAPSEDGCKCKERLIDRVQLNTGGKVVLPDSSLVAPVFLADSNAWMDRDPVVNRAVRDIWRCAHAPPNTLLAQSCLLLI